MRPKGVGVAREGWTAGDSNPVPQQCECCALPDELAARCAGDVRRKKYSAG
jgi:hypothetical protein